MKNLILLLFTVTLFSCHAQGQDSQQSASRKWTSTTIGIPVKNLEKSTEWYQKMLSIDESTIPVPGVLEFKLNDNTWLQLFETTELTTSANVMRFEVSEIQSEHKRLKKLNIAVQDVVIIEGLVAYFDFKDNDGNLLSFYQIY